MLNSRVLFLVPLLTLGCGPLSPLPGDGQSLSEKSNTSLRPKEFPSSQYSANELLPPIDESESESTEQAGLATEFESKQDDGSDVESLANECSGIVDECPVAGGVTWQCKKRYVHGVNYAWHFFSGDFGGIPAWGQGGVATSASVVDKELQDMKVNGANVVRWWVMPDFRGNGVTFDASDTPTGIGPTFEKDLLKALELAEKNDIYLMLTIFSFDSFKPTRNEAGVKIRSLQPIILDLKKRQALLEKVIRPMARIAEQSPYHKRLMTWDLVNEPEWAMAGASKYGDPRYECNSATLQCVTHEQMESFLTDVSRVLRSEGKALLSVGGAAIKWKNAWSHLDLDYLQFHFYDWVNQYYPYTKSPKDWGLTQKPVVMGEFPFNGVPGADATRLMTSWYATGFAGSLGWAVTDSAFNWSSNRIVFKDFSKRNSCQLQF